MICKHCTHLGNVHCGDIDRAHLEIKVQTFLDVAFQNTGGFEVVGEGAVAVTSGFFREVDRFIEGDFFVAADFADKLQESLKFFVRILAVDAAGNSDCAGIDERIKRFGLGFQLDDRVERVTGWFDSHLVMEQIVRAAVADGKDQRSKFRDTLDGKWGAGVAVFHHSTVQADNAGTKVILVDPSKFGDVFGSFAELNETFSVFNSVLKTLLRKHNIFLPKKSVILILQQIFQDASLLHTEKTIIQEIVFCFICCRICSAAA